MEDRLYYAYLTSGVIGVILLTIGGSLDVFIIARYFLMPSSKRNAHSNFLIMNQAAVDAFNMLFVKPLDCAYLLMIVSYDGFPNSLYFRIIDPPQVLLSDSLFNLIGKKITVF